MLGPEMPTRPGRARRITGQFGRALFRVFHGGSVSLAQAVAFLMLLGFFPLLLLLATLLSFSPALSAIAFEIVETLQTVLPPGSRGLVFEYFDRLAAEPVPPLLFGLIGTMLVGSQIVYTLTRAMQGLCPGARVLGFWKGQLRALGLMFVVIGPWVMTTVLMVFAKPFRERLTQELGLVRLVRLIWVAGYASLALLTAILVLVLLYRWGLAAPQRWRDVLPGAALATLLWWLVNSGFGYYVRGVPTVNVVYGGFAAVVGLLIWMYLMAMVVLIGVAFNAERQPHLTREPGTPH